MRSFEFYKKRVEQATEEVFGTERKSERSFSDNLSIIRDGKESKYRKFVAFLDVARDIVPESLQKYYRDSLYDTSELPFNFENFPFEGRLGGGAECNVYLFSSKKEDVPSFVFKVDYIDSGDPETLVEVAKERKVEYEKIKELFGELPELIPEEHFIISEGVHKNEKAGVVASVQKFLGYNLGDIFRMPLEDIKSSCAEDPKLCADIKKFVEISKHLFEEKGEILDILGVNLVIAEQEEGKKLHFIDPHHIYSANSEETDSKVFSLVEERFLYLQKIADEI